MQPPWQHSLARAALELILASMQLQSQRSETLCNGGHLYCPWWLLPFHYVKGEGKGLYSSKHKKFPLNCCRESPAYFKGASCIFACSE